MADFEITHSTQDEVRILSLKGQLDAHTFPSLQHELEVLVREDQPRVVLDCGGLEYISSAGLGVLKQMTREFRERAGDVRLAALTPKIASVVDLLGFSQVIRVYPQRDDAVRSFRELPEA